MIATISPCTLGLLLVAYTDRGVCAVFFGEDVVDIQEQLTALYPTQNIHWKTTDPVWDIVKDQIENPKQLPDLALDLEGTDFQKDVWMALIDIPLGQTKSYKEIAKAVKRPKSARAVANACAANPVSILVPCHRVIHQDKTISGYGGGVWRKEILLAREEQG